MGALETILIVFLLMALFGGGWGYREDWGRGSVGGFGLIVLILLVVLLFRVV